MCDKNKVLKEIYDKSYNLLLEKAIKLNINEDELKGYFDPLSKEHINYYNERYDLKLSEKSLNNKKTHENFLFMRFVSSLYNKGNEYFITNNMMEKQLAESLNKFDLNGFLKHKDFQSYLRTVENNKKCNLLIDKDKRFSKSKNNTDYLEKLYSSIQDVAKYVKKIIDNHKVYNKKAAEYENFNLYFKDVSELISDHEAKQIKGMQITLLADAVKESSIIDTLKPDRHIQHTVYQIFGLSKNLGKADKVNNKTFKRVLNIFFDMAKACDKTIYEIDKVIYMYCAQGDNGFYMHKSNLGDRDNLIKDIQSIEGISNLKY
jgi:hypothetical protein